MAELAFCKRTLAKLRPGSNRLCRIYLIFANKWIEHPDQPVVKLSVKPAAVLAVATILAILAVAEVIVLANINNFPPVVGATPGPNDIKLLSLSHFPLLTRQPLPPGIYVTHPFAIMLKVPDLTADNCVIHNETPSPMPVKHPELKAVPTAEPISEAKK